MIKSIPLNNGTSIPTIGLGTWNMDLDVTAEAVAHAIVEVGYRHIDCASIYGNEKQVGEGIAMAIETGITREELFITSKLWNTDHAPKNADAACRKSLADLGLDYLDLYLMHWAVAFEHGGDAEPLDDAGMAILEATSVQDTWQAMEALVDEGLTKSIGVANFNATHILDIETYANIMPTMNQIELHPYLNQQALVDFCQARDIVVTAYSPLGSTGSSVLKDEVVQSIAKEHDSTPAQVLLAWAISRGTAPIPKSSDQQRMAENFAAANIELTSEQRERLGDLNQDMRFVDPIGWWGFPYFS